MFRIGERGCSAFACAEPIAAELEEQGQLEAPAERAFQLTFAVAVSDQREVIRRKRSFPVFYAAAMVRPIIRAEWGNALRLGPSS